MFHILIAKTLFQEAKIAYARLNELNDVLQHPQLREVTVPTSSGSATLVASGNVFDEENTPSLAVPALSEHVESIKKEFSEFKRPQ